MKLVCMSTLHLYPQLIIDRTLFSFKPHFKEFLHKMYTDIYSVNNSWLFLLFVLWDKGI